MFKPGISLVSSAFPYDISLFIEPIQVVFSLLSQILGLDSDRLVTKVLIGTLYLVSQSKNEVCLNYDEFLVEKITSQLDNFHSSGKIFRYQTLLMMIVINRNLQTL